MVLIPAGTFMMGSVDSRTPDAQPVHPVTLDAFYISMEHARPFSIGINCALGAREMRPYLEELARIADCYVSCYPNAGLPNAFGQYDELPDETAQLLREFAERLKSCISKSDTVGRFGSDECALLKMGIDGTTDVISLTRGGMSRPIAYGEVGIYRDSVILGRPGDPDSEISIRFGYLVGLLGAAMICVGGIIRQAEGDRARKPPGTV